MKRKFTFFCLCIFIVLLVAGPFRISAQTATTSVTYTGFQACGGCTVCGADYWCFNTPGSYCGNTAACGTSSFIDPVPPGNIVTNISLEYWSAHCTGGTIDVTIDGNPFPTVNETSTGCLCSALPCAMTGSSTATYPCGISGYNYGGPNSLTICTGANVCMQRIDITITYAPESESTPAGPAGAISGLTPLCVGATQTYSIAAVTGAATYTWTVPAGWTIQSGQGTTSIIVQAGAAAGNICVTPSNLCGAGAPACYAVSSNPLPVAPVSATVDNNNFCTGTFANITLTGNGGSGSTMNWYTGSCGGSYISSGTSITILAPATGSTTYFTDWTNSCGTTGCANVTVNVNALPTPSISGGASICAGNTATLDAGVYSSYLWSTGASTETIPVTATGTYTVTVTTAAGCTGSASASVTVTSALNPIITGPTTICPGGNVTLDAGLYSLYTWSSGPSTETITVATSGIYTVTVTNSAGCTGSTSVNVIASPNLSPTITGPTSFCAGTTTTLDAGAGYASYLWSNTDSTETISVTTANTYIVTVTNAVGCSGTASVVVNTSPNLNPIISGPSAICNGGSATLDAGFGYTSYSWSNSDTTETITANTAGTYIVTVSNSSGCTGTNSISISISIPTVNPGPNVTICIGTSTTLNASGDSTYSWSPASTLNNPFIANPTATPTSATTYTVTAYNSIGCSATGSVTVNLFPTDVPVISYSSEHTGFCDSVSVSDTLNAGSGYTAYIWSTGAGTQTIFVNVPGTYTVTVVDNHGCVYTSSGLTIYVEPPINKPIILAASTPVFCQGDSVLLYVNNPYYTYHWSSGSTPVPHVWAYESETFVVTVTDSLGCVSVSDPFQVQTYPLPIAEAACQNALLNVSFYDLSTYATNWYWDFGDGQNSTLENPTHTYATAGTYTVILTATDSCGSDNDTLIVKVPGPAGIIEYGNDFQDLLVYPVPVSDNVNVAFYAAHNTDAELQIHDLMGKLIYEESLSGLNGKYIKSISMSGQAAGMYFIELRSDKSFIIKKFSKQ